MRILLGVTGGVAAFKSASIIRGLVDLGHEVRVIATQNALNFIGETTLANLSRNKVHLDLYADTEEGAHIELADWAEKVLVAPATASLIGRYANGIATDLLTNVLMATGAPVAIAPAMHSNMYMNQATQENLRRLKERGIVEIEPVVGRLSGNDSGIGRLPEPEHIVQQFLGARLLAGLRAVVTLGGTQEPIDTVRYIGNRSSGIQGLAFAKTLQDLGAEVRLIAANVSVVTDNFETISAVSFEAMEKALNDAECEFLVMAAAVGDYRVEGSQSKLPRAEQTLTLKPSDDLVTKFKLANPSTTVLAFSVADQSEDWVKVGREKKLAKGVDYLLANSTAAFESEESVACLIGDDELMLEGSKQEIASKAMDHIKNSLTTGH